MKLISCALVVFALVAVSHAQTALTLNSLNGPYDVKSGEWHHSVVTAASDALTISVEPCLAVPIDWYVKIGSQASAVDTPVFEWSKAVGSEIVKPYTVPGVKAGDKVYISVKNSDATRTGEFKIDATTSAAGSGLTLGGDGKVTLTAKECGVGDDHEHAEGSDVQELEVSWIGTGSATHEFQVYWHEGNPADEGKTLSTVCGVEDTFKDGGGHDHRRLLEEGEAGHAEDKGTGFKTWTKNVEKACLLETKKGKTYYVNVMVRTADGKTESVYKTAVINTAGSAARLALSFGFVLAATIFAMVF